MPSNLMIVESPAKIKKLSEILGQDWKVVASFGHIRDLPLEDLGISIPSFKPTYVIPPDVKGSGGRVFSKKKVVNDLKALVRQFHASNIYLATDPDREGEAISWHLIDELNLPLNTKRVTFGEVTPTAVLNGVNNPRTLNVHLVYAQEARRCLDRFVGWLVSPILCQIANTKGLSAGRVQSPALLLIVTREREIATFKPTSHYGAQCFFDSNQWSAEWLTTPNYTNEENPYFLDKTFAAKVSAIKQFKVKSFKQSEEKRSPPAPFITVSLQQAASVALNFSPDVTMKLAQTLKDAGHITYHRTDNPNVSPDSMPAIREQAAINGLDMHSTQRLFKAKESAQEGHPAITPTHWEVETAGDTPEQRALYQMIRIRAIASQLADARYAVRTSHLIATTDDGQPVEFQAKGRTLIYDGWLKLIAGDQTVDGEDAEATATNPIPDLQPGQLLLVSNSKLLEKQTRRPPRYTEASLVGALESEGIGRPATYAAIISNIFNKGYVGIEKKSKKYIEPMPTAYLIVDALVGTFGFVALDYTNYIETTLDEIAQGKLSFKDVMKYFYDELLSEIGTIQLPAQPAQITSAPPTQTSSDQETAIPCPSCGTGKLHKRPGKFGQFWACSAYPNCETSFPDVNGKPNLTPKAASQTQDNNAPKVKCPACGTGSLQLKTGKTGKFWGCNTYPKCKKTISDKDGQPNI